MVKLNLKLINSEIVDVKKKQSRACTGSAIDRCFGIDTHACSGTQYDECSTYDYDYCTGLASDICDKDYCNMPSKDNN